MDAAGKGAPHGLLGAVLRKQGAARQVFTFVVALGLYACVQALYGIYVNSLGARARARADAAWARGRAARVALSRAGR